MGLKTLFLFVADGTTIYIYIVPFLRCKTDYFESIKMVVDN